MLFSVVTPFVAFAGTAAAANTIVVDDDAGSGDYSSIQTAVDNANAGDTIEIKNGTYKESVTITTSDLKIVGATPKGPVVTGDGIGAGSRPHATFFVKGKTKNVEISGLTISNPRGTYGIYAGTGGSSGEVSGLTVTDNRIEAIGTKLKAGETGSGSSPPLSGAISGVYVRADYTNITISNNRIQTVSAPSSDPGRAAGISLSSFVGSGIFDGNSAQNTLIENNVISGIDTPARAKGISASGEFTGLTIRGNDVSDVGGGDRGLGITLTENVGDYDGDGSTERIGPRNFVIENNVVDSIDADTPSALFVGGYETLGDKHVVTRNSFLDGAVERFAGDQPGYTVGDGDTLNAPENYYGSAIGPSGEGPGDGVPVRTVGTDANGNPVTEKVNFIPILDAPADEGGEAFFPVFNTNQETGFADIQDAVDNANAGDTILVENGTYDETVDITKPLTLEAATGATPVIEPQSSASPSRILEVNTNDTIVRGLTIRGVDGATDDHTGIYVGAGTPTLNNTIVGNDVSNVLTGVQAAGADPSGTVIRENRVSDAAVGVSVNGKVTAENNTLLVSSNGEGVGIGGSIGSNVVQNNLIVMNQSADLGYSPNSAVTVYSSGNNTVRDNTIRNRVGRTLDLRESAGELNGETGSDRVVNFAFSNDLGRFAVIFEGTDDSGNPIFTPAVFADLTTAENTASKGEDVFAAGSVPFNPVVVDTQGVSVLGNGEATIAADSGVAVTLKADGTAVKEFQIVGSRAGPGLAANSGHVGVSVQADDTIVADNDIRSFYGGVQTLSNAANTTVYNNTVREAAFGIGSQGASEYIARNDVVGELQGVAVLGPNATLINNTIAVNDTGLTESQLDDGTFDFSDDNVGSRALEIGTFSRDSSKPDGLYAANNDIRSTDIGLYVQGDDGTSTLRRNNIVGDRFSIFVKGDNIDEPVDAELNWWGSERGPAALDDDITSYPVDTDPFLTAPISEVPEEVEETQQFAVDLRIDDTPTALGVPGATEQTVGEAFSDFKGVVYQFDAEAQAWVPVEDPETELEALDALLVVPADGERPRVVFDFEDASSATDTVPAEREVSEGWNFVGAPTYGPAEDVFGASTAELGRVADTFVEPLSQPDGRSSAEFGSYTFGADDRGPLVSPYEGYFVYVNDADGGDGIAAVTYPGITAQGADEPGIEVA